MPIAMSLLLPNPSQGIQTVGYGEKALTQHMYLIL